MSKGVKDFLDTRIDPETPVSLPVAILVLVCTTVVILGVGRWAIGRSQGNTSYYNLRIQQLSALPQDKDNDLQAELELGMTYYLKGDTQRGMALIKQLYQEHPQDRDVLLDWGQILSDQSQFRESNEVLEQLVRLDPDYEAAKLDLTLGRNSYELQDYQTAIKYYTNGLQRDPSSAPDHYYLGLAYQQLGDVQKAIKALKQAVLIAGSYPEAEEILAELQEK